MRRCFAEPVRAVRCGGEHSQPKLPYLAKKLFREGKSIWSGPAIPNAEMYRPIFRPGELNHRKPNAVLDSQVITPR